MEGTEETRKGVMIPEKVRSKAKEEADRLNHGSDLIRRILEDQYILHWKRGEVKEQAEELKDESKEVTAEEEEGREQVAEDEVQVQDEEEVNKVEEQSETGKKIRAHLDHAKRMLEEARRKVEGRDQLCYLETGLVELNGIIHALEEMFAKVNEEGSEDQKKKFNILLKLALKLQMDCLNKITWIQENEGMRHLPLAKTWKWNCKEKRYWRWRKAILKYLRYFPGELTISSLIEDYMKDCKARIVIKEKIEECESVEEALKKIDSIYDKHEAFRVEEEKMKIPGVCRENPSYGSYYEKENAKTLLAYVMKVEAYNEKRDGDESIKYHLGIRFKLKFLSKLSERSGKEIVQNGDSMADRTMKTYKQGLINILKRFPDYLEEYFEPQRVGDLDEDKEQGYQTDEEVCSNDEEEGYYGHESADSDYDYQ